jgi:hypothetical protein
MASLPEAELRKLDASRTFAGRTAARLARQLDGKRPRPALKRPGELPGATRQETCEAKCQA